MVSSCKAIFDSWQQWIVYNLLGFTKLVSIVWLPCPICAAAMVTWWCVLSTMNRRAWNQETGSNCDFLLFIFTQLKPQSLLYISGWYVWNYVALLCWICPQYITLLANITIYAALWNANHPINLCTQSFTWVCWKYLPFIETPCYFFTGIGAIMKLPWGASEASLNDECKLYVYDKQQSNLERVKLLNVQYFG